MHTILDQANRKTTNDQCLASRWSIPKDNWSGAVRTLLSGLIGSVVFSPQTGYSLSLNDAVNAQLSVVNNQACFILLEPNSDTDDLKEGSGLQDICDRSVPSGAAPSSSTGGNAATPSTLPSVIEGRMEDARSDEESNESDTHATVMLGKGKNFFISGEYESLDRDTTSFEDGYDSDIWRLTLGMDVQLTQRTLAGLAFDAYKQDGNFDGGGNFDIESYGIIAFGSWLPTDRTFLQAYGEYAYQPNDRTRIATFTQLDEFGTFVEEFTGRPDAEFDTNQFSGGILLGYDYSIDNVTIGPRAAFDAVYTDFESYEEKNDDSGLSLGFRSESETSLQSSLGLQGSVAVSTGFGVVVAQGGASWKHEFDKDQRNADVYFVDDNRKKNFKYETERPDRDFFEYNIGLVFVLPRDVQTFVNYRVLDGHEYFDNQAVTIGFRAGL